MLTRRDSIKLFAGLLTGSLFQMVPTVQERPFCSGAKRPPERHNP